MHQEVFNKYANDSNLVSNEWIERSRNYISSELLIQQMYIKNYSGTIITMYVADILRPVLLPILLYDLAFCSSKIMRDHISHVLLSTSLDLVKHCLGQRVRQIPLPLSMSEIWWEGDFITRGMFMTKPNVWSKFGEKYSRRPSESFITLCHDVALASGLKVCQHFIEFSTL